MTILLAVKSIVHVSHMNDGEEEGPGEWCTICASFPPPLPPLKVHAGRDLQGRRLSENQMISLSLECPCLEPNSQGVASSWTKGKRQFSGDCNLVHKACQTNSPFLYMG